MVVGGAGCGVNLKADAADAVAGTAAEVVELVPNGSAVVVKACGTEVPVDVEYGW